MEENVQMQFFAYNKGNIACIEGNVCCLYGILVGGTVQYGSDGAVKSMVHRVPLIGHELKPGALMTGNKVGEFNIIGQPDSFTLDHLKKVALSQSEWGTFRGIAGCLDELKDLGVKVLGDVKAVMEVKVDKGFFTMKDLPVDNRKLIYELARLRDFLVWGHYEFVSDGCAESQQKISIIETILSNVYTHGLYRAKMNNGDGHVYYDGTFLFSEDLGWIEETNFPVFHEKYPDLKKVIKGMSDF